MHLSAEDVARLATLKGRNQILLYLAAVARSQWWTTTRELASMASVPARRAELELAALAADGWLDRKWSGNGNASHFRMSGDRDQSDRGDRDQSDRGTAIKVIGVPRSNRSGSSSSSPARPDPDPCPDPRSMDQRVRPSGEVQEGEGTDARTECSELRSTDVQWIADQWRVSGTVARRQGLKLLELGLQRRELREYLEAARRGTHAAFAGLELARYPLAVACTAERVEPWRASQARPVRRGPSVREQLEREHAPSMPAPDEMTAIAELVSRRMREG